MCVCVYTCIDKHLHSCVCVCAGWLLDCTRLPALSLNPFAVISKYQPERGRYVRGINTLFMSMHL